MKPLLKYPGGKARLGPRIAVALGLSPQKPATVPYIEPFLGSGAAFLYLRAGGFIRGPAYLSDCNPRLIAFHRAIQQAPERVATLLSDVAQFPTGPGWEDQYTSIRDAYNAASSGFDWHAQGNGGLVPSSIVLHAARLVWLNHAGFNGLFRENAAGYYNVPVGAYKRVALPTEADILAVSKLLQGATLSCCDFRDCEAAVNAEYAINDDPEFSQLVLTTKRPLRFYYCDPPYFPRNAKPAKGDAAAEARAGFTGYSGKFEISEQTALATFALNAAKAGSRVVISNHDVPEARAIYRTHARIETIDVLRSISNDGEDRKPVGELIVTYGSDVVISEAPSETEKTKQSGASMAANFVRQITGNVKRGGVDRVLERRVLVIGPNESGKSAIVDALKLALGGFIDDAAGHDDVTLPRDLMALVPGRAGALDVRAILDDDSIATFHAEGGVDSATKRTPPKLPPGIAHLTPDQIFPMRVIRSALIGRDPKLARRFLLQQCAGAITGGDVKARIPAVIWDRVASVAPRGSDVLPTDALLAAAEACGKRQTEESSKARALLAQVDERSAALPTLATEAQREAVAVELAAAQEAQVAALAALRSAGHVGQLYDADSQLAAAASRLKRAEDRLLTASIAAADDADRVVAALAADTAYKAYKDQIEGHNASYAAAQTKIVRANAAILLLDRQIEAERAQCTACGSAIGLDAAVARRTAFDDARKMLTVEAKGHADAAHEPYTGNHADAFSEVADLTALQAEVDTQHAWVAKWERILPLIEPAISANKRVETAQAKARQFDMASARWDEISKCREASTIAEGEKNAWKQAKEACDRAVKELLDTAVTRFCERVQAFLPETDKFVLRLREGDRETVQFGLERDGILETILSGGTWARVIAALCAAITPIGQPLAILELPDRSFDPNTLRGVLDGLANFHGQVVVTTTTKPHGKPSGWQVIDLYPPPAKRSPKAAAAAAGAGGAVDVAEGSGAQASQVVDLD